MNGQTALFADIHERKTPRFLTHFYSKADIMRLWCIQDHKQFETFIGEEGKKVLSWRSGKQKFTPKQFRELIAIVGLPIQRHELTNN